MAVKHAVQYLRVSTIDQHPENQLGDLQQLVQQRGWTMVREYRDPSRTVFQFPVAAGEIHGFHTVRPIVASAYPAMFGELRLTRTARTKPRMRETYLVRTSDHFLQPTKVAGTWLICPNSS